MDKTMQNENELQEEEIHALLDRAWETERLCVSEDLIQRTLKRVKEEETKVVSFEKAAKRKISPMKYIGVAAAAVFVLALGVQTFRNGGFSVKDNVQMEATNDTASRKTEALYDSLADGVSAESSKNGASGHMYYSTNDFDDSSDQAIAGEAAADMAMPETDAFERGTEIREEDDCMRAMTVALSQRLTDVLRAVGATPVSDTAECWEFVAGETDWEKELLNCITAGVEFETELSHSGMYEYVLECKDGSQETVGYHTPLDLIVRIETKQGTLWGLFGETESFVME